MQTFVNVTLIGFATAIKFIVPFGNDNEPMVGGDPSTWGPPLDGPKGQIGEHCSGKDENDQWNAQECEKGLECMEREGENSVCVEPMVGGNPATWGPPLVSILGKAWDTCGGRDENGEWNLIQECEEGLACIDTVCLPNLCQSG